MSFVRYTSKGEEVQKGILTDINQSPIFLIPGITASGLELKALAESLKKIFKESGQSQREIFIWVDPRLVDATNTKDYTLPELVALITAQMQAVFPTGPYLVAGYSAGATKAVLAAGKLKKETGKESHAFIIDSASPEHLQKYFCAGNADATADLLDIFHYLAGLHQLPQVTLKQAELTALSQKSMEDQATDLFALFSVKAAAKRLKEREIGPLFDKFTVFSNIVINEINSISNFKPDPSLPPLQEVGVYQTKSTVTKFKKLGWETYGRVKVVQEVDAEHKSLMSTTKTDEVAKVIHGYFNDRLAHQLRSVFPLVIKQGMAREEKIHALYTFMETVAADEEDRESLLSEIQQRLKKNKEKPTSSSSSPSSESPSPTSSGSSSPRKQKTDSTHSESKTPDEGMLSHSETRTRSGTTSRWSVMAPDPGSLSEGSETDLSDSERGPMSDVGVSPSSSFASTPVFTPTTTPSPTPPPSPVVDQRLIRSSHAHIQNSFMTLTPSVTSSPHQGATPSKTKSNSLSVPAPRQTRRQKWQATQPQVASFPGSTFNPRNVGSSRRSLTPDPVSTNRMYKRPGDK